MFGDRYKVIRQSFAEQFEPDGEAFLYRRDQKGPAIRVNADEHSEFIADFDRAVRNSMWGTVGGTILLLVGGAFLWPRALEHEWTLYVGLVALVTLLVGYQMWARYAPARALRYRVMSSPALDKDEARRKALGKLSYGQLAIGALAVPFMLWNASRAWDIQHGWGRLWIVAGVALFVLIAVQAVRKWWYARTGR